MTTHTLESLRSYVGFGEKDAELVRGLADTLKPHLPAIVDAFYEALLSNPEARAVLADEAQIPRLRGSLRRWLERLLCGAYDLAYFQERENAGRTHVRVGLPQHLMFGAMEALRQSIERAVRRAAPPDAEERLAALRKLLAIELAVMLESYKESYSERVRDVERSTMQERLTRAQHLAKIGELAASLAHEIKNPLAGISGAIQVIRDSMEPSAPHRPILAEILRQIDRLDGTVKDLLVYARPVPPRFDECDLRRVAEHCLMVVRREPDLQGLRFESNMENAPPAIEADERQIEQLLMNLVLNAAQASSPGGVVRIVARLDSHRGAGRSRDSGDDAFVAIRVEDDGHGMDPHMCRRAFEPFLTTKSKGTGLGLSICEKIVEMHGGSIALASQPGRGTIVTVTLPVEQPVDAVGGLA